MAFDDFGGLEEAVMAENLITTICSVLKSFGANGIKHFHQTGFIPVRSALGFFGESFSSELTDAKNNCLNKIFANFSTHIFTSYHSTMVKKILNNLKLIFFRNNIFFTKTRSFFYSFSPFLSDSEKFSSL